MAWVANLLSLAENRGGIRPLASVDREVCLAGAKAGGIRKNGFLPFKGEKISSTTSSTTSLNDFLVSVSVCGGA